MIIITSKKSNIFDSYVKSLTDTEWKLEKIKINYKTIETPLLKHLGFNTTHMKEKKVKI